jgi:hypothetical protein
MKTYCINRKLGISVLVTTVFMLGTAFVIAAISVSAFPTGPSRLSPGNNAGVPMATSGNNVYMTWANNDTGHFNVFFAKSVDGGKTLNTMMISAPNKGHTLDQNTEISASGNNLYVTWWTNKTGILMPVFRASNDNGSTFGKTMLLNSTGSPCANKANSTASNSTNSTASNSSHIVKSDLLFGGPTVDIPRTTLVNFAYLPPEVNSLCPH